MSTNKNLPAYLEKMDAEVLEMNFKEQTLKMSFNPDEFFCHSDGTILQGGFITTMLDASMAFLVMQLVDFKKVPLSIDVNVNFLSSGGPKLTIAVARINKIGKSIAFSSADLFQDDELIATASSSIKLKDFESRNWIDDTIGKNVKIIR
jgi:acyl-coenzyme A thioesterase PaaI-like protein